MNKILTISAISSVMLLAGLAACTSTKTVPATVSDLTGEWNIVKVNGTDVTTPTDQEQPYISFDTKNGQLSGYTSCNRIMGTFDEKSTPGVIDLSHIGSTRMMCPDMQLENDILSGLANVDSYRFGADGDIELCHGDTTLLLLQKREPSISAAELKGTWRIAELNGRELSADTTAVYQMTFDPTDKSFSCETGCNMVNGSYDSEVTDMTFHSIASTRMACPDMSVEDSLNTILPRITSFGILAGGGAGFYDSDNNMLMLLER